MLRRNGGNRHGRSLHQKSNRRKIGNGLVSLAPTGHHGRMICDMPIDLHPASASILRSWLHGVVSANDFQRFFSMPNSDYIPIAECLVRAMLGG